LFGTVEEWCYSPSACTPQRAAAFLLLLLWLWDAELFRKLGYPLLYLPLLGFLGFGNRNLFF
jgi:hypothetical protein